MLSLSPETVLHKKLCLYVNILTLWQRKMNLVSHNSLNEIWSRHIFDSLQLADYITGNNKKIIDIGSGAGFPGLILAINDNKNTYFLIESIMKKAKFLNEVKLRLGLNNVQVINQRVESLDKSFEADYIVSRAVASLDKLLEYTRPLLRAKGKAIFLKGATYAKELESLKNTPFNKLFNFKIENNQIDSTGKIIIVSRKNYETN